MGLEIIREYTFKDFMEHRPIDRRLLIRALEKRIIRADGAEYLRGIK
jgi:hypothetical protein